jgi:hypothetical protein
MIQQLLIQTQQSVVLSPHQKLQQLAQIQLQSQQQQQPQHD